MRKMMNEQLPISKSSPLKARFYDYPYFTYPWHFHTEYEIIYVKEGTGMRFVGNNAEKYADGDILLLGSDLPHYMKSDEVYRQEGSTLRTTGTIIQFEKDFMHHAFNYYPHFNHYPFSPTQCSKQRLYLSLHRQFHFRLDQLLS